MAVELDFPTICDRITTHAVNAGRALRNPITDVAFGPPPMTVTARTVRVFYTGEADPTPLMGGVNVMNGTMVAERVVVMGHWLVSNLSTTQMRTVVLEVREYKNQLKTRLFADSTLNVGQAAVGGAATDIDIGYAGIDYAVINGAQAIVLEVEILCAYEEYAVGVA